MLSQVQKRWLEISLGVCVSFVAASAGCDRHKGGDINGVATTSPAESDQTNSDSAADVPPEKTDPIPVDSTDTSDETSMVYLEQGWSDETREQFYYLTQGSQLVPYSWFLALEQVGSQELFRSDANMEELGFISQPASRDNPDALPIGFAKDDNRASVMDSYAMKKAFLGPDYKIEDYPGTNSWLGLTCAACHTNDIHFQGVVIRIDGGPAMADPETFQVDLAAALRATHNDDAKFARFAQRVREGLDDAGGSDVEAAALRKRLNAYTGAFEKEINGNRVAGHPYGFARLDAFGAILNKVCAASLEIPENLKPSNAPVSFPFLWDTPHLDWVQWNGSAANAIARNVGEVVGVFAHLKLTGTPPEGQFTSTVNIQKLFQLEDWVADLSAPMWPEEFLGKIDAEKAQLGKGLYAENCTKCHGVRDAGLEFPMTKANKFGKQFIKTHMITVFPPDKDKIGTDPMMVKNVVTRTAKTGALSEALGGRPVDAAAKVLGVAVRGVIRRKLSEISRHTPEELKELALKLSGYRDPDINPPNVFGYKARPLNGIWATAPYLHNGSVPNLYQLLLPAKDRVKSFYVGSREFDPIQVGFDTTEADGMFEFDATIEGNRNSGHEGHWYTQTKGADGEFRDFEEEEIMALIEYMKTLK